MLLLDGFEFTHDADRCRVSIWTQMLYSRPRMTALITWLNRQPVGAASVILVGEAAVLGSAATLPAFCRPEVQRALIEAQLAVAAEAGCELAAAAPVAIRSIADSSSSELREHACVRRVIYEDVKFPSRPPCLHENILISA